MQVIYVAVNAMRPDHRGCYGFEQDTTPNIDRVAEDGIRFDRAYAANTPCMPSRAALISGRYGISNGVETHGARGRRMHGPRTLGYLGERRVGRSDATRGVSQRSRP
jgi:arylsulfatase A-like enzyme